MAQQMVTIRNRSRDFHLVPHDHVEIFEGKEVRIPVDGAIQMPRAQAIKFLGQWYPFVKDGNGDVTDSKALRADDIGEASSDRQAAFISQIDGKDYVTREALNAHYAEYKHLALKEDIKDELRSEFRQTTGSKAKAYVCHICDSEFASKPALLSHVRSHDTPADPQ